MAAEMAELERMDQVSWLQIFLLLLIARVWRNDVQTYFSWSYCPLLATSMCPSMSRSSGFFRIKMEFGILTSSGRLRVGFCNHMAVEALWFLVCVCGVPQKFWKATEHVVVRFKAGPQTYILPYVILGAVSVPGDISDSWHSLSQPLRAELISGWCLVQQVCYVRFWGNRGVTLNLKPHSSNPKPQIQIPESISRTSCINP